MDSYLVLSDDDFSPRFTLYISVTYMVKIGKNIIPNDGNNAASTLPTAVTGNISAPTVVTFIQAHHIALPKPYKLGFTPIS